MSVDFVLLREDAALAHQLAIEFGMRRKRSTPVRPKGVVEHDEVARGKWCRDGSTLDRLRELVKIGCLRE